MNIFDNYIEDLPIRKVSISVGKIENNNYKQLNLFETEEETNKDDNITKVMDEIANKFGENALLKASSLYEYSTIKKRNNTLGGHSK